MRYTPPLSEDTVDGRNGKDGAFVALMLFTLKLLISFREGMRYVG